MDFANPSLRFSRAEAQLSCKLGDEIAILNLDTKLYFGLSEVGALIWDELETPRSFEELASVVTGTFDVEPQQCRTDLANFLGVMRDRKLLKLWD